MAYRRRQGMTRSTTFNDHIYHPHHHQHQKEEDEEDGFKFRKHPFSSSPALHRLSSPSFPSSHSKGDNSDDYKYGFWGVLATKAKSLLDDDQQPPQTAPNPTALAVAHTSVDGAALLKGLGSGNALEVPRFHIQEGRMVAHNKTLNTIQPTGGLRIRTRGINSSDATQPPALPNPETQLKASRDVAMATAAKAKLLLRELKAVKAELAFANERCRQLEDENKQLRENRGKGENHMDDDMIRLQLEILLAEKTRLAHENSIMARENRFLREIVEYHHLTMQDLVYVEENEDDEQLREAYCPDNPYFIYDTPRIRNADCFLQPSSPRDVDECDEAPPPDQDAQLDASSNPVIHVAASQQGSPVLPTNNHF